MWRSCLRKLRKSRDSRLLAVGATLGALVLASSGCVIIDDPYYDDGYYDNTYGHGAGSGCELYYGGRVHETLDTDEIMDVEPGQGAGLMVEYLAGGTWQLWTTCDTDYTGLSCNFDVEVVTSAPIESVSNVVLEGYERVDITGDYQLFFDASTGVDYDQVTFDTTPGASIDVELVLDGCVEPQYIYWVRNNQVLHGGVGSPIAFTPDIP